MPKLTIVLIWLYFLNISAQSHWNLQVGNAINYNVFTIANGIETLQTPLGTNRKQIKYGLGSGFTTDISFFKSNTSDSIPWLFGATLSYFNSNATRISEQENSLNNTSQQTIAKYTGAYLLPSIGLQYRIRKLPLQTWLAIALPVFFKTKEVTAAFFNKSQISNENRLVNYYWRPGLYLKQNVQMVKSKNLKLLFKLDFMLLNLSRKSRKISSYNANNGTSQNSMYPNYADKNLAYLRENDLQQGQKLNDPIFNPNGFNPNNARQVFTFADALSNIGIGLTLQYNFIKNP